MIVVFSCLYFKIKPVTFGYSDTNFFTNSVKYNRTVFINQYFTLEMFVYRL